MKILFFYILRKFFVKLEISTDKIVLKKGLIFFKTSVLPIKSVVLISQKQSFFMRIIGAKHIEIKTLNGKIRFFLPKDEPLRLLPKNLESTRKAGALEIIFGAFTEARALGEIAVFSAVSQRMSAVLGAGALDGLLSAVFDTAEELLAVLSFFKLTLPKIAAAAAVVLAAAWGFSFMRKCLSLWRFSIAKAGNFAVVKSGFITLYEHALVLNSAAAVCRDGAFSLLMKRRPLYYAGILAYPFADDAEMTKILRKYFGVKEARGKPFSPPPRAFFAHCGAALWSFFGAGAALFLTIILNLPAGSVLKTLLFAALMISLYAAVLFFLYMRKSKCFFGENIIFSFRKNGRLYTAYFPRKTVCKSVFSQNILQRLGGLCDVYIFTDERKKLKARGLLKEVFFEL